MPKPHRLAGFDYHGRIRGFITCCTQDRHVAFDDGGVCEFVLSELFDKARQSKIEITAYCFMPDHGHLLLTGTSDESHLPTLMRQWKQATGYWYAQRADRRLWLHNYWDRVLRDPDDSLQVALYIISDPIRTGLVECLDDYAWWGSERWSRDELRAQAEAPRPDWWPEQ